MTRVAIVGGSGRMGQAIAKGLAAHPEHVVVVLVSRSEPRETFGAVWQKSLDDISADDIDAVVDFSTPAATRESLAWSLAHHLPLVIGTSGFGSSEIDAWADTITRAHGHVLLAANFSIGAVLAQRFSAMAAPHFSRVEVVEYHHDEKKDAPSGTALATARAIAHARHDAGLPDMVDPTEHETAPHARGAVLEGGVQIHSLRLTGLVAHQESIFGSPGEGLTIRHDSYDRSSFVAGVALALAHVQRRPGLTVGLDDLV